MMKLSMKVATGLAVLGLAGSALAATPATDPAAAPAAKTATVHKHHRKVAQADAKKEQGKVEQKAAPAPAKKDVKAEKPTTSAPSAAAAPTAPPAK